jgi:hypothetical protein
MDITFISDLVTRIGLPIATAIIFLWIVVDFYTLLKSEVKSYLKEQAAILTKQAGTVENIAKAIELFAITLEKLCTMATELLVLVKELKNGNGNGATQ